MKFEMGTATNSTKLLVTSDWQCSLRTLDQCEAVVADILDRAAAVDWVLHLGDLKDSFNPVDQRVTNFLVHAVEEISKRTRLIVLLGNHDRVAPADGVQSCLPVARAAGAAVFEEPGVIPLGRGVYLACVPYYRDGAQLRETLKKAAVVARRKPASWLLAFHAGVRGCRLTAASEAVFREAVSLEDLCADQYVACLGGHVHYRQRIGQNVWYAGSPFAQNWGEANQAKGYLLVTVADGRAEVKAVPGSLPGWYDPGLPGFKAPRSWSGARVRIRVPVVSNVTTDLARARQQAEKKYPGAALELVPWVAEEGVEFHPKPGGSDRDLVRRYLAQMPTPPDSVGQAAGYLQRRLSAVGGVGVGVRELRFKSVKAVNVLSYKQASLSVPAAGLVLVTGVNRDWVGRSNGSGKSNLLSLPMVALFGATPKGQTHDAWLRRGADELGWVRLQMQLGDGKTLTIYRQRQPARLNVVLAGRDVTMGDMHGTQRVIEQVTGLTWDVVMNSLYVGQREVATILTGTDKERKELFSRFLGLDRFLKAQELVRTDLRGNASAIESCDGERQLAASLGQQARGVIGRLRKEVPAGSQSEVKKLTKELVVLRRTCGRLQKVRQALQAKLEQCRTKRSKAEAAFSNASGQRKALSKQTERLDTVRDRCPLCGQRVRLATLARHRKELEQEALRLATAIDECEVAVERWHKHCLGIQDKIIRVDAKLASYQLQQEELAGKRAAAREVWKATRRTERLVVEQRVVLRKHVRAARLHQVYCDQLRNDRTFLERCLAVVGREGLPAFLCAAACPALNAAAAEYANLIAGGTVRVEFTLTNGELDVVVINAQGGPRLEDQSQGELRLAGLIAILAFRSVLAPYNMIILDEPGEGLDSGNAAVFAQALGTIAQRFGCVFLTTHNPFMLAELTPDRHLEVVKQNGISRVEVVHEGRW